MSEQPAQDASWAAKLTKMPLGSFSGGAPSVGSSASAALSFVHGEKAQPAPAFPHCVLGVSNFDSALRDAKKRGGKVLVSAKPEKGAPPFATVQTPGGATFTVIHRFRRAPIASVVVLVKDVAEAADFWERCVGLERSGAVGIVKADQASMAAALAAGDGAGAGAVAYADAPEAEAPLLPPLEALHAVSGPDAARAETLEGRQWCVLTGGSPRTSTSVVLLQSLPERGDGASADGDAPLRWSTSDAVVTLRVPSVAECYGWIVRRPETEVDPGFDEAAAVAAAKSGSEAPRHPQGVDTRVPPLLATDLDGNIIRLVQEA